MKINRASVVFLKTEQENLLNDIQLLITKVYDISVCKKCDGKDMRAIGLVSKNKVLRYRCLKCGSKQRGKLKVNWDLESSINLIKKLHKLRNSWEREADLYSGKIVESDSVLEIQSKIHTRRLELSNLSVIKHNIDARSKAKRHVSRKVASQVWQRDGGKCVECGGCENLEFDHIIPFSKGGATSLNNIQLLCRKCNREKSNKI